jgi:hypothetical protein
MPRDVGILYQCLACLLLIPPAFMSSSQVLQLLRVGQDNEPGEAVFWRCRDKAQRTFCGVERAGAK